MLEKKNQKEKRKNLNEILTSFYVFIRSAGLICAEGDLWKEQRRFVTGCLKNFGMAKLPSPKRDRMEERILATVDECISVSSPFRLRCTIARAKLSRQWWPCGMDGRWTACDSRTHTLARNNKFAEVIPTHLFSGNVIAFNEAINFRGISTSLFSLGDLDAKIGCPPAPPPPCVARYEHFYTIIALHRARTALLKYTSAFPKSTFRVG